MGATTQCSKRPALPSRSGVDNPFICSHLKNHLWKRFPLAVTDDVHASPSRPGAGLVHLPLATDPAIFAPGPACPHGRDLPLSDAAVFRIEMLFRRQLGARGPTRRPLPARPPPFRLVARAAWRTALGSGQEVRNIGLGAELNLGSVEIEMLRELAQTESMTIVGEATWTELIPPPATGHSVDYYAGLAQIYRQGLPYLNPTSLLRPTA